MGYRKHVPVNKLGLSGGAGGFGIDLTDLLNDSDLDLKWVSGPFEPGDVLLFHSLTIHSALPNISDNFRCSVDFRYSAIDEPVVTQSLLPHNFGPTFDDLYETWSENDKQKYYWQTDNHKEWNGTSIVKVVKPLGRNIVKYGATGSDIGKLKLDSPCPNEILNSPKEQYVALKKAKEERDGRDPFPIKRVVLSNKGKL